MNLLRSIFLFLALIPVMVTAQDLQRLRPDMPADGKGLVESVAPSGFGVAVAIEGNQAFVGESRGSGETGNVRILLRGDGGLWSQVATLMGPGSEADNLFGETLDADGDRLIVGAPGAAGGVGRAYVYARQTHELWTLEGTLVPPSPTVGAEFAATAVSVSGDRAIVGEWFANGFAHGAAHLYRFDTNTASWVADTTLPARDTGDRFGWGAAISGDRAAVSAYRWKNERGMVYVFQHAVDTWSIEDSLKFENSVPDDRLGYSLDLENERIAAGHRSDNATHAAGYRVFDVDPGLNGWVLTDSVVNHGWIVDLDSSTVISGFADFDYALVASGDTAMGSWAVEDSLFGSANLDGDKFGFDVGVSGDYAIVGAPGDFIGVGRAYIFERNPDSTWSEVSVFEGSGNTIPSVTGPVPCSSGMSDVFECKDVDLRSFLSTTDLGASSMNDVWGWTDPVTNHEYALAGHRSGTVFVDITDPDNPVFVGTLPLHAGSNASTWRDLKTYGNYAFIVADNAGPAGMQVFDLTELRTAQGLSAASAKASSPANLPETFSETAHYDVVGSAHNIAINDSSATAFIVGSDQCGGGIHMVDIASPEFPVSSGCYADSSTGLSGTGYTHDIQCVKYHGPDATYVDSEICFGSNETAVLITDVSDNQNVVSIGKGEYPNSRYVHQGWLSDDHRFFFQDDELDEYTGEVSHTRTLIWDVTDLEDPVLVSEYTSALPAIDHNQYVKGDYLYQAQYAAGLRIIDISGINNSTASKNSIVVPTEVGFFDTSPSGNATNFNGAWSVYPFFESGNVIVTSRAEGLFVLRPNVTSLDADLKVFLEGPYGGGGFMSTSASFRSTVPTANPYKTSLFVGSALELATPDSVTSLPVSFVDWIVAELRTDTDADSAVSTRSAVLLEDGSVVEPTGAQLSFPGVEPGSYYVVIRHRNHLSIMSSSPVDFTSGSGNWDFTTGPGQSYGSNAGKDLGDGTWGMFGGEADLDGGATASDFNAWLTATKAAASGYLLPDFTLDGQVLADDFNLWLVNTKAIASSKVPE